jgi:Ser/Thr protein kinase RdoA (MazF antagonist)
MDDADGGRRGLRARSGLGLLRALRDLWGLGWFAEGVDLGGSSSLNLLVGDTHRRCVVRVHRPHVTPERLDAIHQARRVLLAGGVPCAPLVPTLRGEPWISLQGRLVEVEGYVDHDAVMDSWERLEVGMALLAQTHNLLRHLEVGEEGRWPLFANHLEPADVQTRTRQGIERIRAWRPTAAERSLAAAAEELAELVTQGEAGLTSQLPRQLVHGDFWDNNVWFQGDDIVLILDLDFMGERARIDDLALTLYYTNSTLGAGDDDAQRMAKLRELVDRYDRGLTRKLSAVERAALPYALARTVLAFVGMLASIDDAAARRALVRELVPDLQWSLALVRAADRRQAGFALH